MFDTKQSNPAVNHIPYGQIDMPALVFQAVDDVRELVGGQQIARRIAGSRLVTLTGGHVLLGHEPRIRDEIDRFIATLRR